MRHVVQQEHGIAGKEFYAARRPFSGLGQMQPALAMQRKVEAGLMPSRSRCLPVAAILAHVKNRAFQFETGEKPVGNRFGMGWHGAGNEIVMRCCNADLSHYGFTQPMQPFFC
jgi:hypothetical protein